MFLPSITISKSGDGLGSGDLEVIVGRSEEVVRACGSIPHHEWVGAILSYRLSINGGLVITYIGEGRSRRQPGKSEDRSQGVNQHLGSFVAVIVVGFRIFAPDQFIPPMVRRMRRWNCPVPRLTFKI